MMSLAFIVSQILTAIMYGIFALSYQLKTQKSILIAALTGNAVNMVAFILLGGWSAVAMCVIAIVADVVRYQAEVKGSKFGTSLPFFLMVLLAVGISGWLTYDGVWSLMSVFATMIYRFSTWQKKPIVYKFCGIPVGVFWIIYNLWLGSVVGWVLEAVLLTFAAIGFFRDLGKGKKLKGSGKVEAVAEGV